MGFDQTHLESLPFNSSYVLTVPFLVQCHVLLVMPVNTWM